MCYRFCLIFTLISLFLSGASQSEDKSKIAKKVLKSNAEPVIDKNTFYSPVGRRDPFQSFVPDLKRAQDSFVKNPLQRYELSQLKLIGIITNISVPKAMVVRTANLYAASSPFISLSGLASA